MTFDLLAANWAQNSLASREHVETTCLANCVTAGLEYRVAIAIHADRTLNTRLVIAQLIAQLLHLHKHISSSDDRNLGAFAVRTTAVYIVSVKNFIIEESYDIRCN